MATKLSKSVLKKVCSRHNWCLQWCWNYEKMQAAGYAYAMVPAFREIYKDNETICRNLERHMNFYNTHPGASALICGANIALEEADQAETADSLKVALMGPLAGIGDTIQGVLITPPFNIIAAGMVAEGNYLSILVSTLPLLVLFIIRWPLFNYGYKKGADIINDVSGVGKFDNIQKGSSILGCTVMGGFVPSMIHVSLPIKIGKDLLNEQHEIVYVARTVQEVLDAIFPCLVPIIITGLCLYGIKAKKLKPLTLILVVAIISFILGAVGWML